MQIKCNEKNEYKEYEYATDTKNMRIKLLFFGF